MHRNGHIYTASSNESGWGIPLDWEHVEPSTSVTCSHQMDYSQPLHHTKLSCLSLYVHDQQSHFITQVSGELAMSCHDWKDE